MDKLDEFMNYISSETIEQKRKRIQEERDRKLYRKSAKWGIVGAVVGLLVLILEILRQLKLI